MLRFAHIYAYGDSQWEERTADQIFSEACLSERIVVEQSAI
ncbi:hypothetical protein QUF75_08825 [Desulfococcaceae bacterium HSG7]|nr:hypothetical protein [Desulfococcaceae bacterium HSG7]